MKDKRVLFVLHNHPAFSPGGSEAYTMQLYKAAATLARVGADRACACRPRLEAGGHR